MISPKIRQLSLCASMAALLCVGTAREVRAQGFISPLIGYNYGGDAGCPEITNCEDKRLNWGVALGALGSVVGFEEELAYTGNFFGDTSNQKTNVLTLMSNFMLAPKFGAVQPYGVVGAGLIRTSIETTGITNTTTESQNQVGWDLGGGLMIFFGRNFGIRGDVRYYHSFQVLDVFGLSNILPDLDEAKLDFGRFAGAVVFKF